MEALFPFLEPIIHSASQDISPGRLIESFLLLWIIWRKLKPHLKKIEDRMAGLESAVHTGFNSGESRFSRIETDQMIIRQRVDLIEKTKGPRNEELSRI